MMRARESSASAKIPKLLSRRALKTASHVFSKPAILDMHFYVVILSFQQSFKFIFPDTPKPWKGRQNHRRDF